MQVTLIGQDEWSRNVYKSTKTNIEYVDVDGVLHTMTPDWGEPCDPLCKLADVEIVEGE